jgi:hypothetical protein
MPRRAIMVLGALAVAGALSAALFATASGERRDDRGRPSGVPASIELTPDPLAIQCDGNDASTVTVRVTDSRGRPVPNGTTVHFDAQYGFVDPVEAETRRGEASTQVRLYPHARNYPGFAEVDVFVGDLRASIGIDCAPPPPAGCGPDASPPCPTPTPCGVDFSPPCPEPTLTCNPPGAPPIPLSPPCPTPTPPLEACAGTLVADAQNAQFHLYTNASEEGGVVTLLVGIETLGPATWAVGDWNICEPENVSLITAVPVSGAPPGCQSVDSTESATTVECLYTDAPIATFGDMWELTYACTSVGAAEFEINRRPFPSEVVTLIGGAQRAPATYQNAGTQCTAVRETATPTATPTPPPTPGPGSSQVFAVDADLAADGVQASRPSAVPIGQNFTIDIVLSGDVVPYTAYQISLDYDDVRFDPVGVPPGWAQQPVIDVSSGTPPGTLLWPSGSLCDPVPGSRSLTSEDDSGVANLIMSCADLAFGELSTYTGVILTLVFRCEAPGPGALEFSPDTVFGPETFLLDISIATHVDGVSGASVTCGDGPPAPPPTSTPTRTSTPSSTPTRPPGGGLRPFILPESTPTAASNGRGRVRF